MGGQKSSRGGTLTTSTCLPASLQAHFHKSFASLTFSNICFKQCVQMRAARHHMQCNTSQHPAAMPCHIQQSTTSATMQQTWFGTHTPFCQNIEPGALAPILSHPDALCRTLPSFRTRRWAGGGGHIAGHVTEIRLDEEDAHTKHRLIYSTVEGRCMTGHVTCTNQQSAGGLCVH